MVPTMFSLCTTERSLALSGTPPGAWHALRGTIEKREKSYRSWQLKLALRAVTSPADVGLKREMGFIGAVWASESSIIGSGWLFGALYAAQAAGPAAIIAWVIGGVAVVILALIHAELGAMYPVSGGTARFPHFAFGTVAGMSFGFFSWLQAVTVAPIECFAVMNYGSHWWPALYNTTRGTSPAPASSCASS